MGNQTVWIVFEVHKELNLKQANIGVFVCAISSVSLFQTWRMQPLLCCVTVASTTCRFPLTDHARRIIPLCLLQNKDLGFSCCCSRNTVVI